MTKTLDAQTSFHKTELKNRRTYDLKQGKTLIDLDHAEKEKEAQLLVFKKQIFAEEMKGAWDKQNQFRKTLK